MPGVVVEVAHSYLLTLIRKMSVSKMCRRQTIYVVDTLYTGSLVRALKVKVVGAVELVMTSTLMVVTVVAFIKFTKQMMDQLKLKP